MSKWIIDKTFHFEMGHRVWAQKLDKPELSLSTDCACKHLHGHSYEIRVFLSGSQLDQSAMVTDFKNLNFVKKFLDDNLDHKFMIDVNDPNFAIITGIPDDFNRNADAFNGHIQKRGNFINLTSVVGSDDPNVQLHRTSFVLVNFVPTSENICKHLKEYFSEILRGVAFCSAVELWETRKSHCRYED